MIIHYFLPHNSQFFLLPIILKIMPAQLSLSATFIPNFPQVSSILCEDWNTEVASVSYLHLSFTVKCYSPWLCKLLTVTPKYRGRFLITIKNLNPVVFKFCHINLVADGMNADTHGLIELQLLNSM